MKRLILTIILIILVILTGIWFLFFKNEKIEKSEENIINNESGLNDINNNLNIEKEQKSEKLINPESESILEEPIAEFEERITKKPFGIYITPQNSPIQPEKFQGYHTGVDVEYENIEVEVDVFSMADGEVILSKWVSGYGGVIIISHNIEGESVLSLYGHLRPDPLIDIGNKINKGDKVGVLGRGGTTETDEERKHLHFSIIKGSNINLKGYVQSKEELNNWYDPIEFLNKY